MSVASISPEGLRYVSDLVRRRSAIQLGPGKEYLVECRLLPLAKERGLRGARAVDDYVRLVRTDPAEQTRAVEALTTNETSWFRDTVPFRALADIAQEARRGTLRIWSAGCSTGQEPYSIAITLLEAGQHDFHVVATDLSSVVLQQAQEGVYTQLEVNRGLPAPVLVRYFTRADGGWRVSPTLQRHVSFRRHNLLDAPPPGPFDVVFLRNVLIYFDTATKREILGRVRRVLRPGGYLLLGVAETTVGVDDAWERVESSRTALYRSPGGPS